ncbi:VOC family protein [Flavobacterium branchiophilum]|uniref:Glyoxalase/bleomycin resistance/extradiol dioxygenase family protein n=1 Tax=Flavobacterium branchiophilum TaxID=55197 RepID=A0A2H3L1L6_9FLAO|nr:VOC family protein [Flavobacterium branchiophilum]PDS26786.1 glyoxalase/bleomycin resistance/extradiol dioxygenase family protein [Flavobacterium branchiophilum]
MKQIFINLPVKDVEKSMNFYKHLGFTVNPLFSFNDQKCMVWSDQIYVMLQTHDMFKSGNKKKLANAKTSTIATFTLPVQSIEVMNDIVAKGIKAGSTAPTQTIDEGFMQIRNIEDLDGHHWAVIYLDLDKFKKITGKQ